MKPGRAALPPQESRANSVWGSERFALASACQVQIGTNLRPWSRQRERRSHRPVHLRPMIRTRNLRQNPDQEPEPEPEPEPGRRLFELLENRSPARPLNLNLNQYLNLMNRAGSRMTEGKCNTHLLVAPAPAPARAPANTSMSRRLPRLWLCMCACLRAMATEAVRLSLTDEPDDTHALSAQVYE